MKSMNHRLIATGAAMLFAGSAAMAQFRSAVYGAAGRNDRAASLRPASRQLVAMNSPSNGVFGAVAATTRLPGTGAMHALHAPGVTADGAVAVDIHASPDAHGGPTAANQHVTASAALDMTDTIHAIRAATVQARQSLLSDVSARMAVSDHAMADLSAHAEMLQGAAQTEFKVAVKDVHAQEKALKRSIKTANKARPEGWGEARADLAVRYNAYAEAVAHAEAVASLSARAANSGQVEDRATPPVGADGNGLGRDMVSDDR